MPELGTEIIFAPLAISSYDELYALWQRCPGVGLSAADERLGIAAYLARNPGLSFIARKNDRLVGAILGGHDGRRGYIHHLAVDPDYRRKGIGRRLAQHCLAGLRAQGIQKCHLFIFQENSAARVFWEQIGWTWRKDVRVMSIYT